MKANFERLKTLSYRESAIKKVVASNDESWLPLILKDDTSNEFVKEAFKQATMQRSPRMLSEILKVKEDLRPFLLRASRQYYSTVLFELLKEDATQLFKAPIFHIRLFA